MLHCYCSRNKSKSNPNILIMNANAIVYNFLFNNVASGADGLRCSLANEGRSANQTYSVLFNQTCREINCSLLFKNNSSIHLDILGRGQGSFSLELGAWRKKVVTEESGLQKFEDFWLTFREIEISCISGWWIGDNNCHFSCLFHDKDIPIFTDITNGVEEDGFIRYVIRPWIIIWWEFTASWGHIPFREIVHNEFLWLFCESNFVCWVLMITKI